MFALAHDCHLQLSYTTRCYKSVRKKISTRWKRKRTGIQVQSHTHTHNTHTHNTHTHAHTRAHTYTHTHIKWRRRNLTIRGNCEHAPKVSSRAAESGRVELEGRAVKKREKTSVLVENNMRCFILDPHATPGTESDVFLARISCPRFHGPPRTACLAANALHRRQVPLSDRANSSNEYSSRTSPREDRIP